jgi:hypothetical protein
VDHRNQRRPAVARKNMTGLGRDWQGRGRVDSFTGQACHDLADD